MSKFYTIFFSFCVLITGCVSPDDIRILDSRMLLLERQNSELQIENAKLKEKINDIEVNLKTVAGKGMMGVKTNYAELKANFEIVQDQISKLQGESEEIKYIFENRLTGMNRSVISNTGRLVRLEQFVGFEPSDKIDKVNKGNKSDTTSKSNTPLTKKSNNGQGLSEEQLYWSGKKAFDAGEYEKAREIFRKYLKLYPKSQNADNAQFWSGEIYYREKWYEKAILEYQKVIEKYANGNKVASALLKQGLAFDSLGEKGNSRLILKKLIKMYPKSNEAKIAKNKLKK